MTNPCARVRASRRSREQSLPSTLDHLHTAAPELARFASTATELPAASIEALPASTPADRIRRSLIPRWRQALAATGALVFASFGSVTLAGSAAVAEPAAAPPAPVASNSVVSFGAAPHIAPEFGSTLQAGVIGIAANPAGRGYWLVASDGGVFSLGRAKFFGSTGGEHLNKPIVAMAASPSGKGYWLVASDGGVFTFGDAHFHGSAADLQLASPIVGAAPSPGGHGYWLLGADGGVFAFGDAPFHGAPHDASPAVGIAASPNSRGYWVAHQDGSVRGFGVPLTGNPAIIGSTGDHPNTVGIAASAGGGYWLAQGAAAPVPSLGDDPFLACTRGHESDQAGGYQAVSPGGTYRGAYQFDQGTWNAAAELAGRPDLVGADPATVAPADQDLVAMALFHARGSQPWGGRCGGLS